MLASLARDYLAIPAASVGVERLFNQARDICSYRRHNLKPDTIRALMMLMCSDRFHLRQEFEAVAAAENVEEVNDDGEDRIDDELIGFISDDDESCNELDSDDDVPEEDDISLGID